MCKQDITLRKFIKLFLEVLFYKIIINFIFLITSYSGFTLKDFLLNILIFKEVDPNNFVNCYLLFYLLIPFINVFIKALNEKQHL